MRFQCIVLDYVWVVFSSQKRTLSIVLNELKLLYLSPTMSTFSNERLTRKIGLKCGGQLQVERLI